MLRVLRCFSAKNKKNLFRRPWKSVSLFKASDSLWKADYLIDDTAVLTGISSIIHLCWQKWMIISFIYTVGCWHGFYRCTLLHAVHVCHASHHITRHHTMFFPFVLLCFFFCCCWGCFSVCFSVLHANLVVVISFFSWCLVCWLHHGWNGPG